MLVLPLPQLLSGATRVSGPCFHRSGSRSTPVKHAPALSGSVCVTAKRTSACDVSIPPFCKLDALFVGFRNVALEKARVI